jgi:hypothetical protein
MKSKTVLDPASSMRSFYFDKKDERVVFGDIREEETHLLTNGQTIHIKPDEVMDFREIPYPDEAFHLVVFDPPHRIKLTSESDFIKKYGNLQKESWKEDLCLGFKECFRVLKTNGVLVFKWSEVSIKLSQVLQLTDQKPIIGHPSGKRMGTHWIVFIK